METLRIFFIVCLLPALASAQVLPWNCNFDDGTLTGNCNVNQDTSDNGRDWIVFNTFTPTSDTGPSSAHSPNWYFYYETSNPVNSGDVARFTTPNLEYSGSVCVDFWYHMFGASMGSLKVFSQTGSDSSSRQDSDFLVSGNQGDLWINAKVTVELNSNAGRVGWQAMKGNEIQSDIAVDTISIKQGACPGDVPTGSESSLPYSCTFETDFCNMNQRTDDMFDWVRFTGATPTGNSGPDGASQGSYYAYTEMSSPRNPGDNAILETPVLLYTGDICISFDYHVYGSTVGSFYVTLNSRPENRLLDINADIGTDWNNAKINSNINEGDKVVFTGVTGSDVYGDIAIDDVSITKGRCEGSVRVPLPYTCSFESEDLCQMTQSEDDEFDWERIRDGTDTSGTGPSGPSDGNYYVFTEMSSPRVMNDRAKLESPELSYTGDICIQFDYHAYGVDFGGFYVTLGSDPNNRLLDVTSDQGNQWNPASLNAKISDGDKVIFTAVRGKDVRGDSGLDNVRITTGVCAKTLPYSCSFEDDFCDMIQIETDDFDWARLSVRTPTGGTGPDGAYDGTYFMYTEMSSPRQNGDVARIETPQLDAQGDICVSFYYNAYGSSLGRFYVTQTSNENNIRLDVNSDQGEKWIAADLTFNINRFDKIAFVAVRGSDVYGDFAVDQVRITSGSCGDTPEPTDPPPTGNTLPWTCNLESNFCDMEQLTNDDFDWTRNEGDTGTSDTGPSAAYEGTWYMYTEASSPRQNGDLAAIQTPQFSYNGNGCLRFAYHMYGGAINRFYVAKSSDPNNRLLDVSNDQGNAWKTAQIEVSMSNSDRIVFYAVCGNSIEGDVAVDNIRLTSGLCSGSGDPDPTDAPVTQYVVTSCDMEGDGSSNSNCRITQDNRDNFEWTRTSGKTTSGALHDRRIAGIKYPITGPSSARNGEYYLFTEASGTREGDVARIILGGDEFTRSGDNCLRYSFMMNGYHIGTLRAFMVKNGERTYPWALKEDQSPDWKQAAVDIDMDGVSQIGIEAIMIGDFSGDIALDDVSMTRGNCEPTPSGYLWRCRFEMDDGASSFCGMTQSDNDQFDWSIGSGPTESEETGPDSAYDGAYYIFIEASSPRRSGDSAKIFAPNQDRSGDICVEFRYNMYGYHIGTLRLITRNNSGDETTEWELIGQQGTQWTETRVSLSNVQRSDLIGFVGIRADEYSGDIALDNIRISSGGC